MKVISKDKSVFPFRNQTYDFFARTHIMGVVNVTPDSFSDGGRFFDTAVAIEHGLRLVKDGADILDIGGESTRPGSEPVSISEELRRVIPVIEKLSRQVKIPISIDTCKAEVARRALEAGAEIINDISALRFDKDMSKVAREFDCPAILMHIKGTPRQMQENPTYANLLPEIREYFEQQISFARQAGLDDSKIILDPGIGFGKTLEHNLEILKNLSYFAQLGRPIALVSPGSLLSAKSWISQSMKD